MHLFPNLLTRININIVLFLISPRYPLIFALSAHSSQGQGYVNIV